MTLQILVLSAQKCSFLSRCVRDSILVVISCKTTGKQMVVYHSELTVLRCSSGTIATCPVVPKKQAIICLEVLRARANFVGFGSSWNTHTVDCSLLSIHHLSRCHRRISKHRDRNFGVFLSTNRHEPFFERLTNCVGSNANSQMFMHYWMYAGPTNA